MQPEAPMRRSLRLPLAASPLVAFVALAACSGLDGGSESPPDDADASTGAPGSGPDTYVPPAKDATAPHPKPDAGHGDGGDAAAPPDDGGGADTSVPDTGPIQPGPFDVTFYVMADSHADPVPEDDLLA